MTFAEARSRRSRFREHGARAAKFYSVGAKIPIGRGFSGGAYAVAVGITKSILQPNAEPLKDRAFNREAASEAGRATIERSVFFLDIGTRLGNVFKLGSATGPASEFEFRSVHDLEAKDFDGATCDVISASVLSASNSVFTFFKGPSSMMVVLTVRRDTALPVQLIGSIEKWYSMPSVTSQPLKKHDAAPKFTLVSVSAGKGRIALRDVDVPDKPTQERLEPEERSADVNTSVEGFFRVNSASLEARSLSGAKHLGEWCASTGEEVLCWGYDYLGLYHPPQPKAFSDPYPPETRFRGAIKTFGDSAGADCALTRAGEVWCWGMNDGGAMGIGSFVFCPDDSGLSKCDANKHPKPARVILPEAMVDLETTAYAVCALGKSGRVWCWGDNSSANVRYPPVETHRTVGSRRSRGVAYYIEPSPVLNEDLGDDNARLFGGGGNMCAEKRDGSLWCWGDNYYSQVSTKPYKGEHRRRVPPMRMAFECP